MTDRVPEAASTNEVLKVLILDDSDDDARLLARKLQRAGIPCAWTRLDSERALRRALDRERWDVVLADYRIPGFGGLEATRIIRDHDPDLPVVMVSGEVGEEVTADVLRAGARDMVLKDRLARLAPAVRRALGDAEARRAARAAREALRRNEERARLVARATNEVVWDWDAADDRIWWGGDVEGYFDRTPAELGQAFRHWHSLLHPDDRTRVLAGLEAWLESGRAQWSDEFRMRRADGAWVWILDRAWLVRDDDGRPVRAVGTMLDVTPTKRVENALRARTAALSERIKELRTLYGVSDVLLNADGDTAGTARAIAELLPGGWQHPEVAEARIVLGGKTHQTDGFRETPWMITAPIPAEDGAPPGRIDMTYQEERPDAHGGPFLREEKELLEEVARRMADTLRRQRAVAARRRSETLHRALTERSTDLVSIVDEEGTIRYESPSLRRLLGYHPSELTGRNVFEIVHPDDRATVREAIEVAHRDPDRTPVVRYRARHADGSWRHLESTGRNLLDDPAVRGFVTNTRDVTERTELESRLRQAQKMEAVGRLAGGIAHDFNNLLTIVRGNVDLLLTETPDGTPARSELEEVMEAAERAAELTRSLLAFSRNQPLQAREVDLRRVLHDAAPLLLRVVGEEVDLRLAPGAEPMPVRADPVQFRQVLVNLAINAREAMVDGGVLRVELRRLAPDDPEAPAVADRPGPGHVLLTVADTGPGMSDEARRKAFEPFFSTKEGGTGLGLATVFGIVKQSGGEVGIESEPGEGATVRVCLPAASGAPAPTAPDPSGLAPTD